MPLEDRTLLHMHIEAVWDIQLPPILQNDVVVLASSNQPPWSLYIAQMATERIYIWHANIDSLTRQILLSRAEKAPTLSIEPDRYVVGREIALKFIGQARITQTQAQLSARLITSNDQELVEAFEAGSATYFFAGERKPLCGAIINGRLLSIAHSARRTAEACELGIETRPEARRQGYALASTLLWTHEVLREGLVPIYSALAENRASLTLAEAAGYRIFARGTNIAGLP